MGVVPGRSTGSVDGMGPEVLIIIVSHGVAALMALVHVIGLAMRPMRKWSAATLLLSLAAAIYGYYDAPPYWERNVAVLLFAEAAVTLTLGWVSWVIGARIFRKLKSGDPHGHVSSRADR